MVRKILKWFLLDDTEEVDVGIVDSEVDKDGASSSVEPQVLLEFSDQRQGLGLGGAEVLVESASSIVDTQETQMTTAIQLLLRVVAPPAIQQTHIMDI